MDGRALVTGASSGIGRALSREFATNGHDVVLVARREERLRTLADDLASNHGVTAEPVPFDLDAPDAAADLWVELGERDLRPAVLVNNVGIGVYGRFGETDRDRERTQVRLNVAVLFELTHRFLQGVGDGGGGAPSDGAGPAPRGVLNVGSFAGFLPGPRMAGYYASKAYVNSFSQSLATEYRDTSVDVSVVCPGPVDTEFQAGAGMEDSMLGSLFTHTPESVASAAYRGLDRGKPVVVPGLPMTLLYLVVRLSPGVLQRRASAWVNRDR